MNELTQISVTLRLLCGKLSKYQLKDALFADIVNQLFHAANAIDDFVESKESTDV